MNPCLPGLFSPVETPYHRRARQAAAKADRHVDAWTAQACAFVLVFGASEREPWLMEQARDYAERHGLPNPPDKRAYGHVSTRLRATKQIEHAGFRLAHDGSPKSLWRVRET